MKIPKEYDKTDRLILFVNLILTAVSFVLVVLQLTGLATTYIWYAGFFAITSFLQAYLSRNDDRQYKRNLLHGFFFMLMLILLYN